MSDVSNEEDLAARWRSRGWRDEATSWLDDCLGRVGMERTGEVSQPHLEPWSTVLSADTNSGRVWLKAMVPGTSFEIGLYDILIRVDPDHVLHPIASDRDRGWLLLPDGGPSLGDRLTGSELVDAMVVALPQYASLQRSMAAAATAVIYDWGDSVVAHPFGGAQLPISWTRRIVGIGPEHPDCLRMRDAYLEVFDDLASHVTLVELFDAACRLAKVSRAVVWDGSPGAIRSYLDERALGEASF